MQIQVAYWHLQKLNGLPYEHLMCYDYSVEKRNEIIDTVLKAGYSIMLRQNKDVLIIWIDNGRFGQK